MGRGGSVRGRLASTLTYGRVSLPAGGFEKGFAAARSRRSRPRQIVR